MPFPKPPSHAITHHHCSFSPVRTMPDPEFPGEDEHLFFVLVEFNVEDVRELKRITELELQGSLDADGLKAFVEVSKSQIVGVSLGR